MIIFFYFFNLNIKLKKNIMLELVGIHRVCRLKINNDIKYNEF